MTIRFGLGNIRGVGGSVLSQIKSVISDAETKLKKKIEKFSWTEIVFYILINIKKDSGMNLIDSGCFSHLGMYRQVQLYEFLQILELKLKDNEIEAIINKMPNSVIEAVEIVEKVCSDRRKTKVNSVKSMLLNKPSVLKDSEEWINNTEEHLLSYPVTCLKLDANSIDTSAKNMSCKDFNLSQRTNNVILCCQVSRASEYSPPAGKMAGKTMAYITVMDNTGSSECIAFPDTYKEYSSLLIKSNTIMVTGKKGNKGSLIIQKVEQL